MTTSAPIDAAQAGAASAASRASRRACWAILLAAWGYSALRAQGLSLTHDEALTALIHVGASLRDVLLHTQNIQSNNHLLNTLGIKALVPWLGDSELVLRVPALVGHALYLAGVHRILTSFQSGARLVASTALLATNPLLLDFFSCARGYALGLGFATLGLCLWLRRCVDPERRTLASGFLCVGAFAASVLSNVAFAYLFAAALLTLALVEVVVRPPGSPSLGRVSLATAWTLGAPLVLWSALLASIYTPAVIERIRGNLTASMTTWGGTSGFWSDTVGSLVTCVLYGKAYLGTATDGFARGAVALAFASALGVVAWRVRSRGLRDPLALAPCALALVPLGIAAALTLQFLRDGTRYPLDRAVIHLVPPFLLLVVLSWEALRSAGARLGHAAGLLVGLGIVHGLLCLNTTHFFLWQYDATTRAAIARIQEDIGDVRLTRPYTLGLNWLHEPAVHYYLGRRHLTWIEPPDRRGPDGTFDYYYVREEDRAVLERRGLTVLATFPVSGGILAKRP